MFIPRENALDLRVNEGAQFAILIHDPENFAIYLSHTTYGRRTVVSLAMWDMARDLGHLLNLNQIVELIVGVASNGC